MTNTETTPQAPREPEQTLQPYQVPPPTSPIEAPRQQKKHRSVAISIIIVVSVLGLLGLGIGGGMVLQSTLKPSSSTSLLSGTDGNTTITQEESSIAAVAEKVNPSVVSIIGVTQSQGYYRTQTGESAGTGIIVSKDGYVLTNNHVIERTTDLTVVDSNGARYTNVRVVGRDPLNDIAFLKITSDTTFTPAELGNSSTLRTGQQVVAIGNALGQYSNTVTSGIVSGTGRPITASGGNGQTESLTDLIQTDASINPGNSGGPLVNMAGQVIGINTAIVEDANGIGFAIPINATKGILKGVLENGKVSRAYLGVNYLSITPDVANEYKLPVKQGAYVYASGNSNPVAADSPAAKAGLQNGDIITKVGTVEIGKAGSLASVIGEYQPSDTVTITYLRGNESRTTDVTFTAFSQ
jgi:serine protease Do